MSHVLMPLPLAIFDSLLYTVVVILGIGLLIFIHEAGHFLVAKLNKVRVEAFSLGFGPVLFGFRKGDTHYRLSAIPLGGYVKMAGETPVDEHTDDPAELMNKSIPARAAIFVAGVVMNAVLAFVLFVIVFRVGVPLSSPVVGSVEPGSPAFKAGLESGDRVLSVNGTRILDFQDVAEEIAYSEGPVDLRIRRNGHHLRIDGVEPVENHTAGLRVLGIRPLPDPHATVADGSSAYTAGLRTGDVIESVDGVPWKDIYAVQRKMADAPPPVRFVVRRNGTLHTFDVTPKVEPTPDADAIVGISPVLDRVAAVEAGSAPSHAGFRADDEIVSVNGKPTASFPAAEEAAKKASPEPVVFALKRGGKTVTLAAVKRPTADAWRRFFDGMVFTQSSITTNVVSLSPPDNFDGGTPARKAGMAEGARIVKVNGRAVSTFSDIKDAIQANSKGEPVRIAWVPFGSDRTVGPVAITPKIPVYRNYGFPSRIAPVTETVKLPGTTAAIAAGMRRSLVTGRKIVQMLGGLLSGRVSAKNLGGPVAIFQISYTAVQRNFMFFLYFLGMLSVNLAILNILPIPILDGGHMLFLLIEAIRRKPLSERAMAAFQWAGLLFLGLLMFFVIIQDVGRLL